MFKRKNHVVAVVGDVHANSTVALCPPSFTLDDGGTYYASKYQIFLWRRWSKFWGEVQEVRKKEKARLTIVVNGEVVDDNYHKTTQLVTKNPADLIRLSASVLEPATSLLKNGEDLIIVRGTEAHTGPSACLDEMVARDLGATPPEPDEPVCYSWWHFRGMFNQTLIDVAHHPGTGHRLPWTKGNDANRLAMRVQIQAMDFGQPLPHLAIRGHNHRDSDSFDNHQTRAIIHPSWQLGSSFGHRLGGDWLKFGGLYVVCREDSYEVVKRYDNWPVSKIWRPDA